MEATENQLLWESNRQAVAVARQALLARAKQEVSVMAVLLPVNTEVLVVMPDP